MHPCWFMVFGGSRCVPGHEECSFKSDPTPHSYCIAGPSYTIYSCFGFFYYYYFVLFCFCLFYNGLRILRKPIDDKTIDVFRKKKLWATIFIIIIIFIRVLYNQPVPLMYIYIYIYSYEMILRLALYNINWPSLV